MATTIESLELEIKSSSQGAESGLKALSASLEKLRAATKGGLGLRSIAKNLQAVNTATNGMNPSAVNNVTGLVKAIQLLKGTKISSTIATQITAISTALNSADFTSGKAKLEELATALSPLSNLPKTNLSSYVNNIKKLPEAFDKIDDNTISAVTQKCKELATALKPLGDEMQKVANGFSAFPAKIQKLLNATNKVPGAFKNTSLATVNLYANIKMTASALSTVVDKISDYVLEMNEYIENVNLFSVAMGKFAGEAGRCAETVGEIMGIDPSEWMRSQGIFMTLATGFGVAGDRAALMSKQLTQLGYDISSFFNIGVEEAMQKLKSGFSGELEPLRNLGYDLSQAKLEATALKLGIDKSVSSMTQAEKAQLRYYAIMTQVTTVQGDMARTLTSPANQLRILKAQVTQAARSIGSIFIPALNAVLPIIIAVTKVIRILANNIASLFGFELPEVDYSGIDSVIGGAEDASEALDNATESAKKLKSYMLGFDELNVIDPNVDTDSSSSGLGEFDFELPTYDFIGDAVDTQVDKIMKKLEPVVEWLKSHLDDIKDVVLAIGVGFLAWEFSGGFISIVEAIKTGGLNKVKLGITMIVTGIVLEFQGAYDIGYEGANFENILKTAIGAALGIGGSLLAFGTSPAGWIVGIGVSLAVLIAGITMGVGDKLKSEDIEKRFGDYVLTDSEISELVDKLTDVPIKGSIKVYLDEVSELSNAKDALESAISKLNSLNFKVQCGVEISQDVYQTAVSDFISSAESYIQEQQIVSAMAVNIIYEDSSTGVGLSEFVSSFYNTSYSELQSLGAKLKTCVSEGFADGVWVEDKFQEALDLQKEIQDILDYISTVEFEAKLEVLKLDASDTSLSYESFTGLLENAQTLIGDKISDLDGIRLEAIKIAKMEFDQNILNGMSATAAQKIYDSAVAEADKKFREGKLELSYGTMDFGLDVIKEKYSDEIEKTIPLLQETTESLFLKGTGAVLPEETYTNIDLLMSQLYDAYYFGLSDLDISSAARKNIKELVNALSPTEKQYKQIAEDALKAGESVPQYVSQGLNDIALLKAMSGDIVAVNDLIGQHLSTDPSFIEMLATCKDAGEGIPKEIAKGLKNNLSVVENEANGTITFISDTMGEKILEVSPTLIKNMEDLGYDISDGLKKGVCDKIEKDKPEYESVWSKLGKWFKDLFGIHSPSTVFAKYGGYLTDGLYEGMDNNIGDIKVWAKNNVITPFNKAMDGALVFAVDVKNNAQKWWSNVKMWWGEKVGAVTNFTTNVKNQSSTWWSNVKTWWNKESSDGVTLMVKAKSAWANLRTALGIPDSFDLKFKLPRIGVNWGTKEFLGFEITYPKGFYTYAQGGFPDVGQMFIAREAGAELVGNIGGRTAVMNNDQIVESVSTGVYQAVLAALGSNSDDGGNTNIIVNLDGEKIYENQQKVARNRGYNLGMGAFSFG